MSRHSIDSGRDTAEFTLIIQKRKNGHFTLATNAMLGFESGGGLTGAHGFAEQYRLRWGVETAYSNYESLRPRTTSRNESVRMLLLSRYSFTTPGRWSATCSGSHSTAGT